MTTASPVTRTSDGGNHRESTTFTANVDDNDNPTPTPPIIEEDWSQRDESFCYYDTVFVPLSLAEAGQESSLRRNNNIGNLPPPPDQSPLVMELRCMESLTPLDMLELSNGQSDTTGNRIWMGAVLFLECMARQVPPKTAVCQQQQLRLWRALVDLRTQLFHGKTVLELGSGTGVALIAVGLAGTTAGRGAMAANDQTASEPKEPYASQPFPVRPSFLTLTDNDANVLSLCRTNCDRNLRGKPDAPGYTVGRLDWGDFCDSRTEASSATDSPNENNGDFETADLLALETKGLKGSLDTVVATDVIYDVATIPILLETAHKLLRPGGHFVLAHVPRADIDCPLSEIGDALESLIADEASKRGFCNPKTSAWEALFGESDETTAILRPSTLSKVWSNETSESERKPPGLVVSPDYDYEELESCGASIMVFVREELAVR